MLDLEPGRHVVVSRAPDSDPELLRYLGELGLVPEAAVELKAFAAFGGPVSLRTEHGEHAISRELAAQIEIDLAS